MESFCCLMNKMLYERKEKFIKKNIIRMYMITFILMIPLLCFIAKYIMYAILNWKDQVVYICYCC